MRFIYFLSFSFSALELVYCMIDNFDHDREYYIVCSDIRIIVHSSVLLSLWHIPMSTFKQNKKSHWKFIIFIYLYWRKWFEYIKFFDLWPFLELMLTPLNESQFCNHSHGGSWIITLSEQCTVNTNEASRSSDESLFPRNIYDGMQFPSCPYSFLNSMSSLSILF
jgi:hypothetical protein